MPFDDDFDWQRKLLPEVIRVCAAHFVGEAPKEEDMRHNTDLIVLKLDPIRVACRLRTHNYLTRYPNEFTIRASRPSGAQTELAKVLSGWGDYIFYGFAAADKKSLAAWFLGDLKVFRLWHHQQLAKGRQPSVMQSNPDGSSKFCAYQIGDLPPEFVIDRELATGPRAVA